MSMRKQKLGLTLTSIMVAVGLSGILAVAGMRLVTNQMNALRVMELIDKGDAIYKFYSNLLHDDKVWWCTLYDEIEEVPPPPNPNIALRECVFGKGGCFSGNAGTAMKLMGPDCQFHEPVIGPPGNRIVKHRFKYDHRRVGAYDFTKEYMDVGVLKKQFESSNVTFIKAGGKTLRDSVMVEPSDGYGWWNVELRWTEVGNNAVDLIFTQKFDAGKWRDAPAAGKRHLPELNYPREFRVRRSTNYLEGSGCGASAVTEIGLHTANRNIDCHGSPLVRTNSSSPLVSCPINGPLGQVVESTSSCSGNRVSVTPTDCGQCRSVIWQIGEGTPDQNVRCALEGLGKMIDYGGRRGTGDNCGAHFIVDTPDHIALTHVCADGGRQYATLMGWPRNNDVWSGGHEVDGQGLKGYRGCDGWGPRGPNAPDCPTYGTSYSYRYPCQAPRCPNPPPAPPPRCPTGKCP